MFVGKVNTAIINKFLLWGAAEKIVPQIKTVQKTNWNTREPLQHPGFTPKTVLKNDKSLLDELKNVYFRGKKKLKLIFYINILHNFQILK